MRNSEIYKYPYFISCHNLIGEQPSSHCYYSLDLYCLGYDNLLIISKKISSNS